MPIRCQPQLTQDPKRGMVVRRDELMAREASLKVQFSEAFEDHELMRDMGEAEALRKCVAELAHVRRELAVYDEEQAARDRGEPDQHYVLTVHDALNVTENAGPSPTLAPRTVRCPDCGQTAGLRVHAIGDAEHATWVTCDQEHRWTEPTIHYLDVRDHVRRSQGVTID
ncbi:hypothetical protein C8D88_11182 [Lentzea atacamensis]|uniref:Uncharacterized protein n=2 Tax=Lentzea atacamensis TaxID=531938 RepID=A0A316HRA9_9PSEU|nr:hypothetical protein C8D88_11182 [Lentzea atacamensis]